MDIMKLENSKFKTLLESSLNRYQKDDLLVGNVVTIKPNALKHEDLVDRDQSFKDLIASKIKTKELLRVASVDPDSHMIDVYEELAPGSFGNIFTLPCKVLRRHDAGINMPPAAGMKRKSKNTKPELDPHSNILHTYPMDNSLPTSNAKMSNANQWPSAPGGRKSQKY